MTYEEFKQLAEHPQHRDVPAIFKLEVLETEELEEKKRSHYPKYEVNTYCPQAFTTTLEEAESLMHQDVLYRKKMKEEDDYPLDTFCYYISEIPLGLLHYDRECLSERVYDGEGKLIENHDHVPSLYVFAPHYHVPLYLQRRFKGYLEKAEKKQKEEEEKDRIFRQAHDCCFSNKEQIEKSEKCGCFFCGEIFSPSEITDYLPDEPPTAECPFCHTDSIIGDASGFHITKDFLKKMKKRWF